MMKRFLCLLLLGAAVAGCAVKAPGGRVPARTIPVVSAGPERLFPDIARVVLTPLGDDRYDITVTVSSPYDSPEQHADGLRVLAPDGTVLAVHAITRPHSDEQPFTSTLSDVPIPDGITHVTVEGRDRLNGYGGAMVTVEIPDRY